MTPRPEWIGVDWGTSHLRVWLMAGASTVLEARTSDQGMSRLTPDAFEDVLVGLVGDVLGDHPVPVICCGMVGSRQGWVEAAYRAVPCAPPGMDDATRVPTKDARLSVHVLPGVSQSRPADVMRGEETQIAGFVARNPGWDGVVCLPGTHTKWVHLSAGEIVSFQTYMTGEMFALLSGHSVLRHSVGATGWKEAAFAAAVDDAMARPQGVSATLFSLRAEALLNGLDPATARARLSGLLIGMELAGARPYWLGQPVVVMGEDTMAQAYVTALQAQAAEVRAVDVTEMTLAGLAAARATQDTTA